MKRLGIVLVIAIVGGWALWKAQQPARGLQSLPDWPAVETAAVSSLVIDRYGQPTVRLERSGQDWRVTAGEASPVPADASAVTQLLDDLATMRPVRLVAHGHKADAAFQLDERQRVRIRLLDANGRELMALDVGKPAADLVSTYVRRKGDDAVVTVDKVLRWQVMRTAQGWKKPGEKPKPTPEANKDATAKGAAAEG